MRFVSVRDLRGRSAEVWKRLTEDRELVVTSNGKPVAILSAVSEDTLEESLAAVRRARAVAAVEALQSRSLAAGRDRVTPRQIKAETSAVRKRRAR
ncbi:MAG: type II toxin-antitoxin system prevent-host-death family antitoxin [Myxococcales bacterium]|nr:type II toxin-antitoxin system prevent-host-death family antitoxin [Myxococcales bacterium]